MAGNLLTWVLSAAAAGSSVPVGATIQTNGTAPYRSSNSKAQGRKEKRRSKRSGEKSSGNRMAPSESKQRHRRR